MILTEQEENFFKTHKEFLTKFYDRRISQLFDDILMMPKGEERDASLLMLKEYKGFLNSINVLGTDTKLGKTTLI
jgi:hypothetical protein